MWWWLLACAGPGPFALDDPDPDGDGFTVAEGDCDDADASVHPATTERCDGVDNDCDGLVDTDDPGLVDPIDGFFDDDEDGWGDGDEPRRACAESREFAVVDGDCDDGDPTIHPEAREECGNGVDEDCDGVDPEDLDADGDGYDQCLDCDDADPLFNPDAIDFCDNGLDEDCSGEADDDTGLNTWFGDFDGDGWGTESGRWESCREPRDDMVLVAGDCDDFDATVNPDAEEVWYDGVDQDCAGDDDYDQDADGDRSEDHGGADCDDTDPSTSSRADEKLDRIDHDCDGAVDGGTLTAASRAAFWPRAPDIGVGSDVHHADVTDDGIADLLVVGAEHAWVIAGPLRADLALTTATAHLLFDHETGNTVRGGDFTGDGIGDLVLGTPGAGSTGSVLLFAGPLTGTLLEDEATLELSFESTDGGVGSRLHTADFDGDGIAELLVTGTRTAGRSESGALWVYEGPLSATSAPVATLTPSTGNDLAHALDTLDDFDGDGLVDLVLGCPESNLSGEAGVGVVQVHTGTPADWSVQGADLELTGEPGGDFGRTVGQAGDIDGDGLSDFWATAPGAGEARLYLGAAAPTASTWDDHEVALSGLDGLDALQPLASGDYDGDGAPDVALASDGALWMVAGPLSASLDVTTNGLHATGSESAGAVLRTVDANLDRYADLLVADPGHDAGGVDNTGAVFLLTGRGW